jgi:hypothetical protein
MWHSDFGISTQRTRVILGIVGNSEKAGITGML